MYVIFPAEDLIELTLNRPPQPKPQQHRCTCNCQFLQQTEASTSHRPSLFRSRLLSNPFASADNNSRNKKATSASAPKKNLKPDKNIAKMTANMNEPQSIKDLSHPSFNDQLKSYNTATFKLVRTVSDFSQELSRAHEDHATALQHIVANYRKKNSELRKERPGYQSSLFHTWEGLLQEVEFDSQAQSEVASILARQVSRPLLDRSFHRKVQARKIFGHRDSFEIIITKCEEKLSKCRQDYKAAYLAHLSAGNQNSLTAYIEAHNTYVRQLHSTNAMVEQYSKDTLPILLQELEEVFTELSSLVSDSLSQGTEIITTKSADQSKRYEIIGTQCKSIVPNADINSFVKYLSPLPTQPHPSHRLRMFMYPQPVNIDQDGAVPGTSNSDYTADATAQLLPKNELVVEYTTLSDVREKYDNLRVEAVKLETQIKQLQDSLDTLLRIQERSLESSLYNKVNELQEDISMKLYDLRIAQIQLASIRAQKDLFGTKLDNLEAASRDRKLSIASNATMKSKWLKAFKSLKTTSPPNGGSGKDYDRKNEMYHAVSTIIAMRKTGREGFQINSSPELVHQFQEYTYKKITPCDVCSQVLRGHTRQGLKCRLCKMNVHLDCQEKVTKKCQTKSRLLRRQKSTSEIETRIAGALPEDEAMSLPNTPANYSPGSVSPNHAGNRRISWKPHTSINNNFNNNPSYSRQNSPTTSAIGFGQEENPNSDPNSYQMLNNQPSAMTQIIAPDEPPRKMLQPTATNRSNTSLNVVSPPTASSSDYGGMMTQRHNTTTTETIRKRRLFSGVRSFTMFGGKSQGRSISLPEKQVQYAAGTRPFGQPLMLSRAPPENGDANPKQTNKNSGVLNIIVYAQNRARSFTCIHGWLAPHSPRRHKINWRMKSVSLDSSEPPDYCQQKNHVVGASTTAYNEPLSNHSSSSKLQSPSSPVHNRRLLSARPMRMSSVELPNENEKSPSSASNSPIPSPVKPQRLLPANLYVVLYNFKARHLDELDLKAGYKVTVIDMTDQDWWKGKCLGRVGYFPSKYVTKLQFGERVLQVTDNLHVVATDNTDKRLTLLRDQIVIQVGDELDGMIMIRNGDNQQGVCPLEFLQEV